MPELFVAFAELGIDRGKLGVGAPLPGMLPQGMDEQQHDDDEQPHENVDHDGQDTAARIDAVNDGLIDDHLGLAGVEDTGVVITGKHVGHRTLDIARRTLHILLLEHQQG